MVTAVCVDNMEQNPLSYFGGLQNTCVEYPERRAFLVPVLRASTCALVIGAVTSETNPPYPVVQYCTVLSTLTPS